MRPYAKLSELKPGDVIELDNGFTCASGKQPVVALYGGLYFFCKVGAHALVGQLARDNDTLVGIYHADKENGREEQMR